MFRVLRIKYFIKSLFAGLFLCGVSIFFLNICGFITDAKILLKKPVNLNELAIEDIQGGVRVKAEISKIYGVYCTHEKNGKVKRKEYLILVGEKDNPRFMGLVCGGSKMKKADAIRQFHQDYSDGKRASVNSLKPLKIKGTIMPLEGEAYDLYQQSIDKLNLSEKEREIFLPYAVKMGIISTYGYSKSSATILRVFLIAVLLSGILTIYIGVIGGNIRKIEKYCREQGDKEMYMRELEDFYKSGIPVQGIRMDEQYFMAVRGADCFFAESRDLLWVYKRITRHYTNGIPMGKTYALIVKKEDGTGFDIPMGKEAEADEAMKYVARKMPYLFFGYENDLRKKYFRNLDEMIYEVQRRRQEYLQRCEKQNEE